jgi:hypothetical protein
MKTVREWMQTEVWSTRTSKKIVLSGLILLLVAFGVLLIFEHWSNPWEHQAAKAMLKHAEMVRSARSEDFSREVEAAKASEDLAERRAWTNRDQQVEAVVSGVIVAAEICRKSELDSIMARREDSVARRQMYEQLAQFGSTMCNVYEMNESASRHALNTRLGF